MKTILLCIALSQPVFASTNIIDPNHVLENVDVYLASKSFSEALTCGASATLTNHIDSVYYDCQSGFCFGLNTGQVTDYQQVIADCTEQEVTLANDLGKNQLITKADYERVKGNLARLFLENIEEFTGLKGDLMISKVTPAKFKMDVGLPTEHPLDVMNIEGEFKLKDYATTEPIMLTVSKETPAVAQVLRLRYGSAVWFRLKSL